MVLRKCQFCSKVQEVSDSYECGRLVRKDNEGNKWSANLCFLCSSVRTKRLCRIQVNECSVCSKVFVTKKKKATLCSAKCTMYKHKEYYAEYAKNYRKSGKSKESSKKSYRKKKTYTKIYVISCDQCGKAHVSRNSRGRFCSKECNRLSKLKGYSDCKTCGIPMNSTRKYCSKVCTPKKTKKRKRPSQKVYRNVICRCGVEFSTYLSTRKYCKPTCSPTIKQSKKLRKRRIKNSKPTWADNKELQKVYDNSGNYQVDHIIPLKHPLVCGLHVPDVKSYTSRGCVVISSIFPRFVIISPIKPIRLF